MGLNVGKIFPKKNYVMLRIFYPVRALSLEVLISNLSLLLRHSFRLLYRWIVMAPLKVLLSVMDMMSLVVMFSSLQ